MLRLHVQCAYKYDAPGSPTVARRALALLAAAGLSHAANESRGWDHGVFVPLMLLFPDAKVPVVQVSLVAGQDAATHLAVGAAGAAARRERLDSWLGCSVPQL
ncbi:Extradiol ring-cleavage dioxygenase, class III enzyme, subunit B [Pelagophyceae sp. CCMP2097]|nr:Extradiol ring-cleavage dioxygenase, class III enzyme, subunit B [Pelagophyceae sp. CCMP2097]|mmetsp:Transcript_8815/g.30341  ORF Transcript_8815/g.30341 Transcript_8815/m.30341 type:complete len:103 (+) Transcript_8815:166-474(+)